jgi:hypothetical protein
VKITATMPGFRSLVRNLNYDANNPTSYSLALQVGSAAETIEVQSNAQMLETLPLERDSKKKDAAASSSASNNVLNLQRRVSGVLPVRVDVPRAGSSYSFVRPLVLDEETKLTFTYKTK